MNVIDAVASACLQVGIKVPAKYRDGQWTVTDTLGGKSGKGDGRVLVSDAYVCAFNWKLGQKSTVWLKDSTSPEVRRQVRQDIARQEDARRRKAAEAASIAASIVAAASIQPHPYLAAKGFPEETALVIGAGDVIKLGGRYLVPAGGENAVVMPARRGDAITSVQLIWEGGEKKFLANGETSGACHRIATGRDTWLCEGFATGLSLRAVLKSLRHSATILCCFSASNLEKIAGQVQGRTFIAADHDKPLPQLGGVGAGEFYARRAALPFFMPPIVGDDFNDIHQRDGIFAAQRLICDFLKGTKR